MIETRVIQVIKFIINKESRSITKNNNDEQRVDLQEKVSIRKEVSDGNIPQKRADLIAVIS